MTRQVNIPLGMQLVENEDAGNRAQEDSIGTEVFKESEYENILRSYWRQTGLRKSEIGD